MAFILCVATIYFVTYTPGLFEKEILIEIWTQAVDGLLCHNEGKLLIKVHYEGFFFSVHFLIYYLLWLSRTSML